MTFGEIKEILEKYINKKKILRAQERRLCELRAKIDDVGAVDYSRDKVVGGNVSSRTEVIIERISALENEIACLMEEIFAMEDVIADKMKECTPLEQAMLIDRYMNEWSWKRIQKHYHYQQKQPYNIINSAIKKMAGK